MNIPEEEVGRDKLARQPSPDPCPDSGHLHDTAPAADLSAIGDPSGPARPVSQVPARLNRAAAASIVLLAGGSTLYLLGGTVGACRGATRSARLLWEQRTAEMQQALAEQRADQAEGDPRGLEPSEADE